MENTKQPTAQELVNTDSVTLDKNSDIENNLNVSGNLVRYPEYNFAAKVFDYGSKSGIDNGRISKLRISNGEREVLNYQRGWEQGQEPENQTSEQKKVLHEILSGFPEIETRKEREVREQQEKQKRVTVNSSNNRNPVVKSRDERIAFFQKQMQQGRDERE